jgi:DNA-binding NtrC family response regulator
MSPRVVRETAPFAFLIDTEEDVCQLVAATLGDFGVDSASFSAAKSALASLDQQWPAIIFLDVVLRQSDAIDMIRGLSERHYNGTLQLISGQKPWLLEAVRRVAARQGLTSRSPLRKPVRGDAIRAAIVGVWARGLYPPILLDYLSSA